MSPADAGAMAVAVHSLLARKMNGKPPPRGQGPEGGYPLVTTQNAAAAVERNALKRGRGWLKYPISPVYSHFPELESDFQRHFPANRV
jgi:hypothetical protein